MARVAILNHSRSRECRIDDKAYEDYAVEEALGRLVSKLVS